MIYNNRINNCKKKSRPCFPIVGLSPFTVTKLNIGETGPTGLSGNNPLISFNSGDYDFENPSDNIVVGLGVAVADSDPTVRSQLGIPILFHSLLSNFEIAYTGSELQSEDETSFIFYRLRVIRSMSNDGVDYTVPTSIVAFSGSFEPPFGDNDISANKLITVPENSSNRIVFPGDRIVLNVTKSNIFSTSLTVGASIHCTPV